MDDLAVLKSTVGDRYVIDGEIGAGGMAIVYVAEDVKHHRKVALKVLRPELAAVIGADRFLREIETTAKLQHPHILPLHDSGTVGGTVFYVMPFVEGESLRDRLTREKQLSVEDAVRITREVASALDYAHRRGVIHRDIKPENILLHEGQALVADFGIALAVSSAAGGTRLTETGMSLGTPHYMSPEQAMGERVLDARTDVYALGCVLYEMLLGEPPFTGPTAQAIIARVMTDEPRAMTIQRKSIPPYVEAAVRRALAKVPADRFATAAEFSTALTGAGYAAPEVSAAYGATRPRAFRSWLGDARTLAAIGAAAILAASVLLMRRPSARDDVATRMLIAPPDSTTGLSYDARLNGGPVVSPDGRIVAFSATTHDTASLFVQPLDRFEPWVVSGGGRLPFFSPDGRWLGFIRGNVVWKVPSSGGDPVRVGAIDDVAWNLYGQLWHPDGRIIVAATRGLWSIPSAGGDAQLMRPTDTSTHLLLRDPRLAPSGEILVTVLDTVWRLALVSANGKVMREVSPALRPPAWFVDDMLVFTQSRQLRAGTFDVREARLSGDAISVSGVPAIGDVAPGPSAAWFDATTLPRLEVVWVTRTNVVTPLGLDVGFYRWPRLSPDGQRLAVYTPERFLSVIDLRTKTRLRLAPSGGEATWTHDGKHIIASFTLSSGAGGGFLRRAADGSGKPDTVLRRADAWPTDVAQADTLTVFYSPFVAGDASDIGVLHVPSGKVTRVAVPGYQRGGRISPDGHWLAFQSAESGRSEVIVQPWPAIDAKYVVSTDGGDEPAWSRDGRELYFRSGDRIMMSRIEPGPSFQAAPPVMLFRGPFVRDLYGDQSYDVAPDGRFLMMRAASDSRVQIRVIHNWAAELRKALAEARK